MESVFVEGIQEEEDVFVTFFCNHSFIHFSLES